MSTTTTRRSVLKIGTAGFAAALAPAWLARAFAQAGEPGTSVEDELKRLDAALARARGVGKPLMVILVPPGEQLRLARGRLWGDAFAFGSDTALAIYALCEWTCLGFEAFGKRYPKLAPTLDDRTVAALIETVEEAGDPLRLRFPTDDLVAPTMKPYPADEMRDRAGRLGEALIAAILPDERALYRRAYAARASAAPEEVLQLPEVGDGQRAPLAAVDRWAAVFLSPNMHSATQEQKRATLAQAFLARVWEKDLAGARWEMEHHDPCPPCGMGYSGLASRRFLHFYAGAGR